MSEEAPPLQPLLPPSKGAANVSATNVSDDITVDTADYHGSHFADSVGGLRSLVGSGSGKWAKLLYGAERMITFTDAVVAIAMTLLILPLMESAVEMDIDDDVGTPSERTSIWFNKHWKNLISLAISFGVIYKYWADHDRLFRYVGQFTNRLIQLNFLWMGGVVFLPVAAALIMAGVEDGDRIANAAYIGNMTSIALIKLAMTLVVRSDENIWKESDCRPGPMIAVNDAITLFLVSLALLISVLAPILSLLPLILLIAQRPMILMVQKLQPNWTY